MLIILEIQPVRLAVLSVNALHGSHHTVFDVMLRDIKTGVHRSKPRRIESDLKAFGGDAPNH